MKKKLAHYRVNPSLQVELEIRIRNRDEPIRTYSFDVRKAPEIAEIFRQVACQLPVDSIFSAQDLPKNLRYQLKFLREVGLLLNVESEAPRNVDPEIWLDEKTLNLVPQKFRLSFIEKLRSENFYINDEVLLQTTANRPPELENIIPTRSIPSGPNLVWVRNFTTLAWAAYRADARQMEFIDNLKKGKISPKNLDLKTLELFVQANILVPAKTKVRPLKSELIQAQEHLEKYQFAVLRGIVPPLQIAGLRNYLSGLKSEGYLRLDTGQVKRQRLEANDDPLASFVHRSFTRLIQKVTGDQIMPTFNYISSYLDGADLPKHKDRGQCGWNVSCLVESNHGLDVKRSWPIYIETNGKKNEIKMDYGDATLYQGRNLFHWRKKMPKNMQQTLLLFFFVPDDFIGELK